MPSTDATALFVIPGEQGLNLPEIGLLIEPSGQTAGWAPATLGSVLEPRRAVRGRTRRAVIRAIRKMGQLGNFDSSRQPITPE